MDLPTGDDSDSSRSDNGFIVVHICSRINCSSDAVMFIKYRSVVGDAPDANWRRVENRKYSQKSLSFLDMTTLGILNTGRVARRTEETIFFKNKAVESLTTTVLLFSLRLRQGQNNGCRVRSTRYWEWYNFSCKTTTAQTSKRKRRTAHNLKRSSPEHYVRLYSLSRTQLALNAYDITFFVILFLLHWCKNSQLTVSEMWRRPSLRFSNIRRIYAFVNY